MKRRRANGDEQDAYSQARHELCCLQRAGIVKKTKRRTHRRERKEGKAEARSEY